MIGMASNISAHARHWQVVALCAVVFPQVDRLPLWLSVVMLTIAISRLAPIESRLGVTGKALRLILFVGGMAGIYYSHRTFIGPEGGVSFLVLSAGFKLLESKDKRDYFVLAVLDFFVLATAFLFSQSLLLAAYVGVATLFVLAALTTLQQSEQTNIGTTIKKASAIALQALPLMLILFVFFPRLPPLWTLNLSQGSGKTGMSDSMSPGDISRLSESSELAFRVEFKGPVPGPDQLYWRGVVLTHYDGNKWTQSDTISWPIPAGEVRPKWVTASNSASTAIGSADAAIQYRVILEPTDQSWLFSLAIPQSPTKKVLFTRDFRLAYQTPVFTRLSYDAKSWSDQLADKDDLPVWLKNQNLQLPASGNQEALQMARRWHLASASDERYIQQILDYFREERFFYTLEPPRLGENRIDDFLFRTRRGFCEHYAAAFVFLMRAAGIPARVVAGYQGGEKSPLDNYWLVRQLDAHAWAEVWLEGKGWVRVDPTAVVAPDRIERGAAQMATQSAYWGNSIASKVRHNNYRLLHSLRNFADYVNYRWYRDVLGYDISSQEGLMQRLLGDNNLLKQLGLMMGLLAVFGGLTLFWIFRGERKKEHPVDRLYRKYCERMAKKGMPREPGEAPFDYAQRIARQMPKMARNAQEIAKIYSALRYRPQKAADGILEKRFARAVKER